MVCSWTARQFPGILVMACEKGGILRKGSGVDGSGWVYWAVLLLGWA